LVEHVGEFVGILNGLEGFVEEGELAKVLESVASVVQALEAERIVEPILVSFDWLLHFACECRADVDQPVCFHRL